MHRIPFTALTTVTALAFSVGVAFAQNSNEGGSNQQSQATDQQNQQPRGQGMMQGQGMPRGQGMMQGQGMPRGQGMMQGRGMHRGQGMMQGRGMHRGQPGGGPTLQTELPNGRIFICNDDMENCLEALERLETMGSANQ